MELHQHLVRVRQSFIRSLEPDDFEPVAPVLVYLWRTNVSPHFCANRSRYIAVQLECRFFSSSVITLTFGALSINDILAAVVMLILYELIDNAFYNPKTKYRPFWLWILNGLKIGVTMGMHADMLKLQGMG